MSPRLLLLVAATALVAVASHGAGLGDDGLFLHGMRARTDSLYLAPSSGGAVADCGDPPATSLAVFLDADNIDGADNATLLDNDPITTWVDLGSIGDDPTQTGASTLKPTFIASCINGKPCARFDGGDWLRASTAANFAFIHNGTGSTAYAVVEHTAGVNASFTEIATVSLAATTSVGFVQFFSDSTGTSNETARALTGDGVSFSTALGSQDSLPLNLWHIVNTRVLNDGGVGSDIILRVDGAQVGAVAATGFSASPPAQALTIGGDGAAMSARLMVGDVRYVLIYADAHDDAERAAVETWIECTTGEMPVAANDNIEDSGLRFAAVNDDVERVARRRRGGA